MNIITLCSIEKTETGYLVRYLKGTHFYTALFTDLENAYKYAELQLHADRDEILLSINK